MLSSIHPLPSKRDCHENKRNIRTGANNTVEVFIFPILHILMAATENRTEERYGQYTYYLRTINKYDRVADHDFPVRSIKMTGG